MSMTTTRTQEWNEFYFIFQFEDGGVHCADWQLFKTPQAETLLKEKAVSFGVLPSVSAYIRAFAALKAEGSIKPVRQRDPMKIEDSERELTSEQYFNMPAAEVRRRFAQEPEFRAQVQHLLAIGAI